eukprot:GEMP01058422.1.p1 GENE.GEMP01058422.1~~GEMP01058422.1.p1  ORF type:complete len:383 (+),score=104.11 GEMP01058422.1:35-1183(+)
MVPLQRLQRSFWVRAAWARATQGRSYVSAVSPQNSHGTRVSDFRSDTVTQACPRMREHMANAVVGDDVFDEDPTVHELERRTAALLGMEKAVFVWSGTMANLLAIGTHCGRGDEILVGVQSHIYNYEQGGASGLLSVSYRPVEQERGRINLKQIKTNADDSHLTRTSLLCLENTHNAGGGAILPPSYMREASDTCRALGICLHVDGARLWNAAIALDVPLHDLLPDGVDSVSVCVSKGLGAPVGSLLAGKADFVKKAKRLRKMVGGGARQAGHLAAAGLVALDRMEELRNDHALARMMADGLKNVGIEVVEPDTNIVFFDLPSGAPQLCERLEQAGVLMLPFSETRIRAVMHRDVNEEGVQLALKIIKTLLEGKIEEEGYCL